MTFFSTDDLKQVFPEATTEALQDPNDIIYTGYAEAYVDAQESAGIIAVTGGSEDAIGGLLDKNDINVEFLELINKCINETSSLLFSTNINLQNIRQNLEKIYEETDWKKLEIVYSKYDELGLKPELVIGPEGFYMDFWYILFRNLRKMQENEDPPNPNKLKLSSKGHDGLVMDMVTVETWNNFIDRPARWSVSIIPTSKEMPRKAYNNITEDIFLPDKSTDELGSLINKIYPTIESDEKLSHPSIENYLMLQALRIMHHKEPLDEKLTILDGEYVEIYKIFLSKERIVWKPFATWSRNAGLISVFSITGAQDTINIRPTYKISYKEVLY